MFDYEEIIEAFEDFNEMRPGKSQKFLKRLLLDETFVEWLFQPKQVPNINEMISALYVKFTKPRVIRALVDMIEDEGYDKFTRSHATFLYSLCNIGIQSNNERIVEISNQKKNGEISGKDADKLNEKTVKYNDYISELLKCAKRIIKGDAKELSRESNLPKYICMTALHSVPEFKYVDRFKIGFYLNNLLNNIYSEVESYGGFSDDARWKTFFKNVFGKDNVVEVATFILLEGVHRIDKYKNSQSVRECWDSLTSFALRELNEAPEALRTQMIELYIKRISKMFANGTFDLRVDLLSINDMSFPKLADTIGKYTSRIEEILTKGRNTK